jgi:hypothetical protein
MWNPHPLLKLQQETRYYDTTFLTLQSTLLVTLWQMTFFDRGLSTKCPVTNPFPFNFLLTSLLALGESGMGNSLHLGQEDGSVHDDRSNARQSVVGGPNTIDPEAALRRVPLTHRNLSRVRRLCRI